MSIPVHVAAHNAVVAILALSEARHHEHTEEVGLLRAVIAGKDAEIAVARADVVTLSNKVVDLTKTIDDLRTRADAMAPKTGPTRGRVLGDGEGGCTVAKE